MQYLDLLHSDGSMKNTCPINFAATIFKHERNLKEMIASPLQPRPKKKKKNSIRSYGSRDICKDFLVVIYLLEEIFQ